jgi:hypothetical protein
MRKTICAGLALCLLAACGKAPQPAPHEAETHAQHEQAPVRDDEFNFTAHQFVDLFNDVARTRGVPYRISAVEIRHGALHDYFQHTFPGGVSLTGSISKESGRVTSITALASGANGNPDRETMLEVSEVIVLATAPDMSRKKAAAMIADMLDESRHSQETGRFPQRFFEHARYVLRSDNGIGYWWIATPN